MKSFLSPATMDSPSFPWLSEVNFVILTVNFPSSFEDLPEGKHGQRSRNPTNLFVGNSDSYIQRSIDFFILYSNI